MILDPEIALKSCSEMVAAAVPGASCELWDYDHRIRIRDAQQRLLGSVRRDFWSPPMFRLIANRLRSLSRDTPDKSP